MPATTAAVRTGSSGWHLRAGPKPVSAHRADGWACIAGRASLRSSCSSAAPPGDGAASHATWTGSSLSCLAVLPRRCQHRMLAGAGGAGRPVKAAAAAHALPAAGAPRTTPGWGCSQVPQARPTSLQKCRAIVVSKTLSTCAGAGHGCLHSSHPSSLSHVPSCLGCKALSVCSCFGTRSTF